MQRFGLLPLLALLACDNIPSTTITTSESATDASTTGSDATGGASTHEPTTGSTGEPSTADASTSSGVEGTEESGSDDTTAPTSESSSGSTAEAPTGCVEPGARCLATGVWCFDLSLFCAKIQLKGQSPNFCQGLASVCTAGEVEPCDVCAGLTEQCELNGAAIPCPDLAAECACIALSD